MPFLISCNTRDFTDDKETAPQNYTRRHHVATVCTLAPLMLLVLLVVGATSAPADTLFPLSVVHLNDFHACFEQIASSSTCSKDDETTCMGGIARVVTEARLLLAERPNALLLNAGDNFQGTLWFTLYGWSLTAAFLNRLPWDAIVLGNHEFDRKLAGLIPFIQALNAPVVVANVDDSKEPLFQGLTKKSVVVERGGRKIGIIGIITSTTKVSSLPEKLEFISERAALAKEGARLKKEGVDIIVVLSHVGIEMELQLAAQDENVDLIVGGHTHTLLYTGTPPLGETPYDVYPVIVTQPSGRKVPVVHAASYSKYLGNMTAFFDSKGELVSAEGIPVFLDKNIQPDAATAAALAAWAKGIAEMARQPVGFSAVLLERRDHSCIRGECNLGSFVADAFVHAYRGRGEAGTWTRAAIGLVIAGSLRAPICPGEVTLKDVMMMLPFGSTVDMVELRGSIIRRALERAVSTPMRWGPQTGDWFYVHYYFLQVSGLRVAYNTSRPAGERVHSVLAVCRACAVRRYEPLKDDEWYPVALNSFLADGGGGYKMFSDEGRNQIKGYPDTAVVLEYLKVHNPVVQNIDGRIVFVE